VVKRGFQKFRWALCLLICLSSAADFVALAPGESMSGRLLRIESGVLVFRTNLSGQMMVPMDTIQALTTKENLALSMNDETAYYGRLIQRDGQAMLLPLGGLAQAIQLSDIRDAEVIPRPKTGTGDESLNKGLHGTLETGVLFRENPDSASAPFIRMEAELRTKRAEVDAEILTGLEGGGASSSLMQGEFVATTRVDAATAPYLHGEFHRESAAPVERRTGLSLGVRHDFSRDDTQALRGFLGLNASREDVHSKGDTTGLGLQLGLRYSRGLFARSELTSAFMAYPSFRRAGDVRLQSQTGLSLPFLTQRLRLHFDLRFEYDKRSAIAESDALRAAFGASVGMDF
jgi:hypothetical protein